MHQRTDNPFLTEVRNGVIITRAMPVASYRLGLYGVCDVVEFTPSPEGIVLPGRPTTYLPAPVEYKHGKAKHDACDEVQLCAQAMCLEEMIPVTIPTGYFYYGEVRHRVGVTLTTELRRLVTDMAAEMHDYFARGHTPRVKPSKACRSCSLAEICLPEIQVQPEPIEHYIRRHIEET